MGYLEIFLCPSYHLHGFGQALGQQFLNKINVCITLNWASSYSMLFSEKSLNSTNSLKPAMIIFKSKKYINNGWELEIIFFFEFLLYFKVFTDWIITLSFCRDRDRYVSAGWQFPSRTFIIMWLYAALSWKSVVMVVTSIFLSTSSIFKAGFKRK
jgi:hypothetical protein